MSMGNWKRPCPRHSGPNILILQLLLLYLGIFFMPHTMDFDVTLMERDMGFWVFKEECRDLLMLLR
jgi:hypothetical protein